MKSKSIFFLLTIGVLIGWAGCGPKTGASLSEEESTAVIEPPEEEGDSCQTFEETVYRDDALDNYVLYRDQLTLNNFNAAFPMWKFVYEKAPDADGKRYNVYTDGVKIYNHFFENTEQAALRKAYLDTVNMLYQQARRCYTAPEEVATLKGMQAFDYYYTYKELVSAEENYQLFTEAFELMGKDAPAFLFNPFTALLVERYLAEEISVEETKKWSDFLRDFIKTKKASTDEQTWRGEGWDIVEGYVPIRLETMEGVEGFFDCAYYKEKYLPELEGNENDCELLRSTYGRLRWGQCDKEDPDVVAIRQSVEANECIKPQGGSGPSSRAFECLREGNYTCAVQKFEEAAEATDDTEKKAQYYLLIAKVYYGNLRRYSTSRTYARKAANLKSNWGEPYILIGKLYASSGPLCGPGRGWDSQVVTWPAIDQWSYAKSIDRNVAAEANQLIGNYRRYMPSKEDIFQRNLQEGQSFRVGCWIQETTTIRAAPQ